MEVLGSNLGPDPGYHEGFHDFPQIVQARFGMAPETRPLPPKSFAVL
jgi:hypothetical protein